MRYVKALEFRPSSGTVHHANIKIDRTRSSRLLDEQESAPGYEGGGSRKAEFPDGHFLGRTPGQSPRVSPDGLAWRLDRDSDLVIETHLMPSGKTEPVQISVGLYFTENAPRLVPYTLRLSRQNIDIAPGERTVLTDAFVLPVDPGCPRRPTARALSRNRGARVRHAAGRHIHGCLLLIKNWDFRWQDSYRYAAPMRLPRGTTLTTAVQLRQLRDERAQSQPASRSASRSARQRRRRWQTGGSRCSRTVRTIARSWTVSRGQTAPR